MAVLQPLPTSAAVVLRTTACRMWFAIMRSLWCGSATQILDRHSRPRSWQSVMISKFRGRRCARAERKRIQQPRHRREHIGELVQIDGSEHRWFEDRAAACTLLVFVDDATSRLMELRFVASESTFA